ncbi:MAG: tetratricopeptide repeat protein [Candidatus Eisenbacteria bacterium]|nr:tetratricopeptide repeat protein [Candidatus Eisenbacteria bacterium]
MEVGDASMARAVPYSQAMPDTIPCPDCGQMNAADAESCVRCNFPLREMPAPGEPLAPHAAVEPPGERPAPSLPFEIPRRRIARPRRPGTTTGLPVSVTLLLGAFIALLLVFVAIQAVMQREQPQVEGSNQGQQQRADSLRRVLAGDSTNVEARVALGDVLFDTGNWGLAIVQYRSAVRQDSTRVPAMVDLGVCYYNLGDPESAERVFRLALARDPHHPFALFNLGIIHEGRKELEPALQYFHRALESAPPENMRPAIIEAMERVQKQLGKVAPPLDNPH